MVEPPGTAGDKSEIHTHKQMQLIAVRVERVHGWETWNRGQPEFQVLFAFLLHN